MPLSSKELAIQHLEIWMDKLTSDEKIKEELRYIIHALIRETRSEACIDTANDIASQAFRMHYETFA